jgi:aminopeptidase N
MRRVSILLGVAACGTSTPPPPPTGPIAADVVSYGLTFDLDSHAAHATVTANVTTAGDCWTLPFRGQMLGTVTLSGDAATATTDATTLTACGKGYEANKALVLDADFTIQLATLGQSQVGYSTKKDSAGNPFFYLLSWVNECDRFTPCDNTPDKFATYHFDITHAASLTVRCPGDVVDVSPTETTCDFGYDGGPTYSTFGVVAYPAWTVTDEGMWGGVHVTLYDRATTGIAAEVDPAFHSAYVAWLENMFGPYPYGPELRVLTGPTYWGGFEHPSNITLNDNLAATFPKPLYTHNVAHTLDHEIAHMWAGDQTTLADTYDFVWKESMAEYLAYVWEDMNDPAVSLATANAWKVFASRALYYPIPDDHPDLLSYYGDVYGPGPMILFHQLETLTSRTQVLAAIASVLGHPHALSVDELLDALTAHTGIDAKAYATGWLHGTGVPAWPKFSLTYTPGAGTSTLELHQTNPGAAAIGCRFHVALTDGASQSVMVAVDTHANGPAQTLSLPTPAFTVTYVDVDPLHECLVFKDSSTPRTAPRNPWVATQDSP